MVGPTHAWSLHVQTSETTHDVAGIAAYTTTTMLRSALYTVVP
jgi:hypothetical protein